MDNIIIGLKIMGQGMAGIFVSIALIMLVIWLIKLVQKPNTSIEKKEEH